MEYLYFLGRFPTNVLDHMILKYIYKDAISAVKAGDLFALKRQIFPWPSSEIVDEAIKRGNLPIVQYLYLLDRYSVHLKYESASRAARYGQLEILRWLSAHPKVKINIPRYRTIFAAASNGHLDCLRFLYDEMGATDSTQGIVCAAIRGGHLNCLQYLCEEDKICFDKEYIMDSAVEENHLHILRYLHSRGLGNMEWVLHRAAALGYLEILKWACAQGIVHTEASVNKAVENGHLDCLQYLYSRGGARCSERSIGIAIDKGYHEILAWLRKAGH